jgi:chaperonin GroEL
VVLDRVAEGDQDFGYNAANDTFGDMFESGIIDPAKVTRSALQNAASIAGLILTTDCMIAQAPNPAPPAAPGMNDMMY